MFRYFLNTFRVYSGPLSRGQRSLKRFLRTHTHTHEREGKHNRRRMAVTILRETVSTRVSSHPTGRANVSSVAVYFPELCPVAVYGTRARICERYTRIVCACTGKRVFSFRIGWDVVVGYGVKDLRANKYIRGARRVLPFRGFPFDEIVYR